MIRKFDNHDANTVSNRKVLFGWVGTAKELRDEIRKQSDMQFEQSDQETIAELMKPAYQK